MYKDQGKGRHRRKRGKLRQFGAEKSDRAAAARDASGRMREAGVTDGRKRPDRSGRKPKARP